MKHDYKPECQCYRCKGIRNAPRHKPSATMRFDRRRKEHASRDEQHARYLDCGPANWDDR